MNGQREQWGQLGFWVAMLSLLITVNAEVFGQRDDPELALFWEPFPRLFGSPPSRLKLSELLSPSNEENVGEAPTIGTGVGKKHYIFAFDVSQSMDDQAVSAEEIERYKPYAEAQGCALPSIEELTGLHVARAELCRFIRILPADSRVALWSFGQEPQQLMPSPNDRHKNEFFVVKSTAGGGRTSEEVVNVGESIRLSDQRTDFERLLDAWVDRYGKYVQQNRELHFVVISDFSHDLGSLKNPQQEDSTWWDSRYRASAASIADRFRGLAGTNQIFHLTRIHGANKEVMAVLPLVGQSLEWYRYRMSNPGGENIDLLRSYRQSAAELPFYHTAGGATRQSRIVVDNPDLQHSTLVMSIATDAASTETIPLRISVEWKNGPKTERRVLRSGGPPLSLNLERINDEIILRPLFVVSEPQAQLHRLLLGWSRAGEEGGTFDDFIYAADIPFRRRLGWFGAAGIIVSFFMIGWHLVFVARSAQEWFKKRRSGDVAADPPGQDQATTAQ